MGKLVEKKDFDLLPFLDNENYSNNINSISKSTITAAQQRIVEITEACGAVLVHECNNFINFSGRDIDTFYISSERLFEFDEKDLILHEREEGSFRFLINHKETSKFINLDFEDLNIFSKKTKLLNEKNFISAKKCQKTSLKHFDLNTIIFYKLIKYFSYGIVHSYEQLFKLKKNLNSLSDNDLKYILNLTSKYLKSENVWINMLVNNDFKSFEKNDDVKKFWIKKRILRQKKRKVYAGKLYLKNLFISKNFLYALLFGNRAKWSKNHKPLPAIALVGNDGSGKTTLINYMLKNYSKMDPAYISMRPDMPILPLVGNLRKGLKKLLKVFFIKKIYPLSLIISLIGQSIDLFDRFIKYKIGMAWADSGFGITLFERYTTDRIRGEFPNIKNKYLPLEQYFPLPDGIVYLDVEPETSLKRKINDNHTLEEMYDKRANYISLLLELDETKTIPCDRDLDLNIRDIKNYIFDLSKKKRERQKMGLHIKRCVWKKNTNRILSGKQINRFQQDSFF